MMQQVMTILRLKRKYLIALIMFNHSLVEELGILLSFSQPLKYNPSHDNKYAPKFKYRKIMEGFVVTTIPPLRRTYLSFGIPISMYPIHFPGVFSEFGALASDYPTLGGFIYSSFLFEDFQCVSFVSYF